MTEGIIYEINCKAKQVVVHSHCRFKVSHSLHNEIHRITDSDENARDFLVRRGFLKSSMSCPGCSSDMNLAPAVNPIYRGQAFSRRLLKYQIILGIVRDQFISAPCQQDIRCTAARTLRFE